MGTECMFLMRVTCRSAQRLDKPAQGGGDNHLVEGPWRVSTTLATATSSCTLERATADLTPNPISRPRAASHARATGGGFPPWDYAWRTARTVAREPWLPSLQFPLPRPLETAARGPHKAGRRGQNSKGGNNKGGGTWSEDSSASERISTKRTRLQLCAT